MDTRKKRRDITFPLVLGILLLFPFLVDEAFVRLKQALRASGGFYGMLEYPDLKARVHPLQPSHCRAKGARGGNPTWPSCDGSEGGQLAGGDSGTGGLSAGSEPPSWGGIDALAAAERAEYELLASRTPASLSEHGVPVAPRPSNPSRFFPEPRHPMLSSGVPLTTSLPDPHWEDPAPREPSRDLASIKKPAQQWPFFDADARPKAAPSPAPEQRIVSAPVHAEEQPSQRPKATWRDQEDRPRLNFKPKKPTPVAKNERLMEVCGRMVPESRAPAALAECAPKSPPEQKHDDEGGNESLVMP